MESSSCRSGNATLHSDKAAGPNLLPAPHQPLVLVSFFIVKNDCKVIEELESFGNCWVAFIIIDNFVRAM